MDELDNDLYLLEFFACNPEAFRRIAKVVTNNAMSLTNCAEVLEAVGPLCSSYTTEGFLHRLKGSRLFYFDFKEEE